MFNYRSGVDDRSRGGENGLVSDEPRRRRRRGRRIKGGNNTRTQCRFGGGGDSGGGKAGGVDRSRRHCAIDTRLGLLYTSFKFNSASNIGLY